MVGRMLVRFKDGAATGLTLCCAADAGGVHYLYDSAVGRFVSIRRGGPAESVDLAGHARGWEAFVLEPAGEGGLPAHESALLQLRRDGFTLLRNMLSPRELVRIKAAVTALEAGVPESGDALPVGAPGYGHRTQKRVHNLCAPAHDAEADLVKAAIDPLLKGVLEGYLGAGFRCATWSSNTLLPGNTPAGPSGLGWHIDYPYHDVDDLGAMRSAGAPPLGVQVLWSIDDFRADNGAPRQESPRRRRCEMESQRLGRDSISHRHR